MQQLKDQGYADKYTSRGELINLIGVDFSKGGYGITVYELELLSI